MRATVAEYRDPHEAYALARDYLLARPADHNLLHTILDQAREFALGGRFWIVGDAGVVSGFALQSPPGRGVVLGRMAPEVVRTLAAAVDPPIPGVQGDAAGAAIFAGHYGSCHGVEVRPAEAQRLYELTGLHGAPSAPGAPRLAASADREKLAGWFRAFASDTGTSAEHAEADVDLRIARERLWVWDDGGLKSMAGYAQPAGGVARVGPVYTPAEYRGAGYATACVHHVSRALTDRGLRCVLYTSLANPTSNAIYRRIGYAPIGEILVYEFSSGGDASPGDSGGGG